MSKGAATDTGAEPCAKRLHSIVVRRQAGGFGGQEVSRRQRSLDRVERARRIAQGEELREIGRAARIGERQRAL
jgi:hypothetical protein